MKLNIGDKISILFDKRETATVIYKDAAYGQILCHLKSNRGWKIMDETQSDKLNKAYNKYKNNTGSFWWISEEDELYNIKLIQRCVNILDIE